MINIIFLDVDGVLCTLRSHYAYNENQKVMEMWDPVACRMIAALCDKWKSRIVFTSTWRNDPNRLKDFAGFYGLCKYLFEDKPGWFTPHRRGIRGSEVKLWWDDARTQWDVLGDYVIIDDDTDFLKSQLPHFIHVIDGKEGFSAQNYMDIEKRWRNFDYVTKKVKTETVRKAKKNS